MTDNEKHEISDAEIAAWKRGSGDAIRNQLLKAATALTADQAVKLLRVYIQAGGDIHYSATRLNTTPEEARRVLKSFGINSFEDAKRVVKSGLVAEYDAAKTAAATEETTSQKLTEKEKAERLAEHQRKFKTGKVVTDDAKLKERQAEAAAKNKRDHIRKLISEGIDPATNTSNFMIDLKDVPTFRAMISAGVGALRRRFGGTEKDIVREIARLSPQTDLDVLRP